MTGTTVTTGPSQRMDALPSIPSSKTPCSSRLPMQPIQANSKLCDDARGTKMSTLVHQGSFTISHSYYLYCFTCAFDRALEPPGGVSQLRFMKWITHSRTGKCQHDAPPIFVLLE